MRKLKKTIKKVLLRSGYQLSRVDNKFNFFELLIDTILRKQNHLFFIQVGANDGKTSDPIYDFVTRHPKNVRGILLEPVKDYFEELRSNYHGRSNVIILNLAIHNSNREMNIYRVDPGRLERQELPIWAKGIASFNQAHHELSGTPGDCIIEEKVQCITFNELLTDYQVQEVDLLQIDTEGYDSEIIRNLDFKVTKPKVIHFEHGLSQGIMSKEGFSALTDVLHNNGYEIWMDSYDATAYQRSLLFDFQ